MIDPFALPSASESLSSISDCGHDVALLFRSTFSLLAEDKKASPDWWLFNDEAWQAFTGSVDETLGAAKQSSIVALDYKINFFFVVFCGGLVRSERNFATVRDELRQISTKFRRQLLERSSTEVDVLDRIRQSSPSRLRRSCLVSPRTRLRLGATTSTACSCWSTTTTASSTSGSSTSPPARCSPTTQIFLSSVRPRWRASSRPKKPFVGPSHRPW